MSADNGIYVLRTKDGYRVREFTNVEDLNYDWELFVWLRYKDCTVYANEADALEEARTIYREIMDSDFPILEYGTLILDYPDLDFPDPRIFIPKRLEGLAEADLSEMFWPCAEELMPYITRIIKDCTITWTSSNNKWTLRRNKNDGPREG